MLKTRLLSMLARSFVAGGLDVDQIVANASDTLGRHWHWVMPVARRYVEAASGHTRLRHRNVAEFIQQDRAFERAWRRLSHVLKVEHWRTEPQGMQPVAAAGSWGVPVIESVGDLADWLWLEPGDLEWFADLKALGYKKSNPRLRHYHYRVLAKQPGGIRLIEAPKPRLKKMQREILGGILECVPSHPAVHGFVKGRSVKTFVAPHVGRHIVLRMDLRNFFASVGGARVQACFRTIGYPEAVADLLGGICTNSVPRDTWRDLPGYNVSDEWENVRSWYARPHLPQGAPTSPALANLCAFHADCRLSGLAKSAGADYTRYADDLAFSGGEDFARGIEQFATHAAAILSEEGFAVQHRKTRIMRQGVRQHLAGLVINRRMNVTRADYDQLKATLTNCIRFGPESQNRDGHAAFRSHLEGRVAFVESVHTVGGQRLRNILGRIRWA